MKSLLKDKKDNIKTKDDTLFGLLSIYKAYNTYFRILINDDNSNIVLQITGNPKKWPKIGEERYKGYRLLKKSELEMIKLSVKYLSPEHLLDQLGSQLGLKIPENDILILNNLNTYGYYSIETKLNYLQNIIITLNKIIDLDPEKKYELLEKCLSKDI